MSETTSSLACCSENAHRLAPTRRCRLVAITVVLIFTASKLLLQSSLSVNQLVSTSLENSLVRKGDYSDYEVGDNTASDLTAPSHLIAKSYSSQEYTSLPSPSPSMTTGGRRTSELPANSGRMLVSLAHKNTARRQPSPDNQTSSSTISYASTKTRAPPSGITQAAPSAAVCPPGPLLTVNGGGRLGNRLCQYFTLWAEHHANFSRTSVWISSKMAQEFSRHFDGQRSITEVPSHCLPKKLLPVRMEDAKNAMQAGHNVCFGGGVCNVEGFARYRERLLSEFPWKEDLASVAAARLTKASQSHGCGATNCTFIGVHMRRTDYPEWIQNRMHGRPVGTEYFQCALSLCRRRYQNAVFIVASDDVDWARANILGEDVALVHDLIPAGNLGNQAAALDMATLSLCNHTIVSYGTYSYMAAFMAGGDIVAPAGYSKVGHFVAESMIRSGWLITLLDYRTCNEVPLDQRAPITGFSVVISCDM